MSPRSAAALPAWRLWIRAAAFFGIAAYIALGPMPHQMFGARHTKALPRWRMFSGMSLKQCAGWFERRDTDPPTRLDDWYAQLGLEQGRTSHRRRAWIEKVDQAERLGQQLCKKLGPGADVRLHLRCPHRTRGWVDRVQGETNLCDDRSATQKARARRGQRAAKPQQVAPAAKASSGSSPKAPNKAPNKSSDKSSNKAPNKPSNKASNKASAGQPRAGGAR